MMTEIEARVECLKEELSKLVTKSGKTAKENERVADLKLEISVFKSYISLVRNKEEEYMQGSTVTLSRLCAEYLWLSSKGDKSTYDVARMSNLETDIEYARQELKCLNQRG